MTMTLIGVVCAKCSNEERKQTGDRKAQVRHESIEEVRTCSMNLHRAQNVGEHIMSDAEETRLLQQREREEEDERVAAYKAQRDDLIERAGKYARQQAAQNINVDVWAEVRKLQALLPNVPKMHYAIEVVDFEVGPAPVWRFYRVDRPTKGKWTGRTFVNAQASDDYYPVRKPETLKAVLTAIAHDPAKAASNYGHQIGQCGYFGRTLTDPESIERGIGPVCAGRLGW